MKRTPAWCLRYAGIVVPVLHFAVIVVAGLKLHVMGDGEAEADFFGAYVLQARAFLAGDVVIDPYRGPVYPIALAIFGKMLAPLGAGLFEAGIVLSALTGAVVLALVHALFRRLVGAGVATAAMLLVALNPVFVRYCYTASTDMFFTGVAVAAVTAVLWGRHPSWVRVVFAGAMLALAYLTRYNGVVLVAAACAATIVLDVWRQRPTRRLASTAVLAGVFVLLVAPWCVHRHVEKGSAFYDQNYRNVLYSLLPPERDDNTVDGVDIAEIESMGEVLSTFPGRLLRSLPERAADRFSADMGVVMRWPVGVFVIVGLLSLLWRRPSRGEAAVYLFAALFYAVLLLVFYSDRFGLLLVPAYALLATRMLFRRPDPVMELGAVRVAAAAVAVALVAFTAWSCVDYNRELIRGGDPKVREMGEWFRANVPPHLRGERVVARKPGFAYFAGLEPVTLPVLQSHEELIAYLHEKKADYLFFSYLAAATRPQLRYLSRHQTPHPGLEVVSATRTAILYRVEPPTP